MGFIGGKTQGLYRQKTYCLMMDSKSEDKILQADSSISRKGHVSNDYPSNITTHFDMTAPSSKKKQHGNKGKKRSTKTKKKMSKAHIQFDIKKADLENMYIDKSMLAHDIALYYDCSDWVIDDRLKKFKIEKRNKHESSLIKWKKYRFDLDAGELYYLYWNRRLTLKQIADLYNAFPTTIYERMIEFNIPRKINFGFKEGHKTWTEGKTWEELYGKEKAEEMKRNNNFQKGHVPWNKGREYHQIRGERNPNWVGGWESYKGEDWGFQRKKARKRDGYKCQFCHTFGNGKKCDVHHITPFRIYGLELYKEANSLQNLITLCPSCHTTNDALFRQIENFYEEIGW